MGNMTSVSSVSFQDILASAITNSIQQSIGLGRLRLHIANSWTTSLYVLQTYKFSSNRMPSLYHEHKANETAHNEDIPPQEYHKMALFILSFYTDTNLSTSFESSITGNVSLLVSTPSSPMPKQAKTKSKSRS